MIGYLSASIEWAQIIGKPKAWHEWWYTPDAKAYYFIGKDNIPFHAVIWPGQLIGAGDWFGNLFEGEEDTQLTLPYDVPANEFMNLEGRKISGSRNWAVWGLDFLTRYDPDTLRYYLTANMPESKDTDWDWEDFRRRNNDELLANWGNLANRVLSFTYKNWDGQVPSDEQQCEIRPADTEVLATVSAGFENVGELISSVRLRAALNECLRLASEVNKYLDQAAPWFEVKNDKLAAGRTVYTALKAIDSLKVLFAPFLPFSSERLHTYLGYNQPLFGEQFTEVRDDSLGEHEVLRYRSGRASGRWEPSQLPSGQVLQKSSPLFKKLDESIVEQERARLGE